MTVRFPFELIRPTEADITGYVLSVPGRHELRYTLGIGFDELDHGVEYADTQRTVSAIHLDNLLLPRGDWREWTGKKLTLDADQGGSMYVHGKHCPATAKFVKLNASDEARWLLDVDIRFDFTGTGFRSGSVKLRGIPCEYRGVFNRFKKKSSAPIKRRTSFAASSTSTPTKSHASAAMPYGSCLEEHDWRAATHRLWE